MTDTDDTDELLLIPPDFFVVESDSELKPYCNIVDKLIKQVNNLQNRLKSLEDTETFLSNSLDYIESPVNMDRPRKNFIKYNSTDELRTSYSAQPTPQKPGFKFKLNSLPNSPYVDRLHNTRNLGKDMDSRFTGDLPPEGRFTNLERDGQVLNEIDTFLSKVKSIQRISAVRNLVNDFDNCVTLKNESQNYKTKEESVPMKKTRQVHDNRNSDPDLSTRYSLYNQDNTRESNNKGYSDSPQDSRVNNSNFRNSIPSLEKSFSDNSSDSTQVTTYTRPNRSRLLTNPIHSTALNILNKHKKLVEDSGENVNHTDDLRGRKKMRNKSAVMDDNLGTEEALMNLADIWNPSSYDSLTSSQLLQKLQEEKYRRQHCEDLIQELQGKNLEMQQKLSVAVKVDDVKNKTVRQFQDTLDKIVVRLEKLNKEKEQQEFEFNKLKHRHKEDKEDTEQRLSHYEKEASKALNLAHANQEKSNVLEKKCEQLELENLSLEKKLKTTEEDYAKECYRYKEISEILAQKELEINENKNALSEIIQSRKAVENCQKDFNKLREEYTKINNKLNEERTQTVKLNKEVMDLLEEVNVRKTRETELQTEIAKLKKQLESNKLELRNFYQGQVEILVQNKLKEFQWQLDQTENNFKDNLKKKEMMIAKSAAFHIQQISEKYSLELKLLEKKHQEEIKLHQIQVKQYKQQADNAQNKLDHFQEKRINVAKQLQKVMESQWNEAMRIISNGKSPTFADNSTVNTTDQLNSLKFKSYNDLEEVLSQHNEDDFNAIKTYKEVEEITSAGSNKEKVVYDDRIGQSTETPVSSRAVATSKPISSEAEIQKYINLLLNKPIGNPSNITEEDLLNEFDGDKEGGIRLFRGQHNHRKGPKPPWK